LSFESDAQPVRARRRSTPESSKPLSTPTTRSWQPAFLAAVVESNRGRAIPMICNTQALLEYRLAQITGDPSGDPTEVLDLRDSLTYLGILLDCVGTEAGEFLWQ